MASLQDLGLSKYEGRAFRALLETGPTTAKELSRTSEVPMGRIYDVLNELEDADLVRTQEATRPKKYAPVEPDAALDRLLADRKRKLEERATEYERIVDELSEELDDAATVEDPFWTAAVGEVESLELLVERLTTAEDRIVIVGAPVPEESDLSAAADRFLEALLDALDRGVTVQMLAAPALFEAVPDSQERASDLAVHDGFELRLTEAVSTTYEVVDGREVCVEVAHPIDGSTFAMIANQDPAFAEEVLAAFETQWEAAEPALA